MGSLKVSYRVCAQSAVVWGSWCQPEAWKRGQKSGPTLPVCCTPQATAAALWNPWDNPLPTATTTTPPHPTPPPAASGPPRFPAWSLVFVCKRITVPSQFLTQVVTPHPRRFPTHSFPPARRRACGLPRPHQETAGINFSRPRCRKPTPRSLRDADPVDFGWSGGGGTEGRTGGGKFCCQVPSLHHFPKDARGKLLGQESKKKEGAGRGGANIQ